jgi:hypothetical protein
MPSAPFMERCGDRAILKVTDEELERARNQILMAQVESLKSIHGKAEALGDQ